MEIFKDFQQQVVFFSKIIGIPIYRKNGSKLGVLKDFFVDYYELYPQVIAIQYSHRGQLYYLEWESIIQFSPEQLIVIDDINPRLGKTYPKVHTQKNLNSKVTTIDFPTVGKMILNRQIVDTNGKKVVRVNDLTFIKIGNLLRITHAEVGFRSMMRMLGFDQMLFPILKFFNPKSTYYNNQSRISWRYVHTVPDRIYANLKLNVSNEQLSKLHPADLADILEELDAHGRENIFKSLDEETQAEILTEVDEDLQASLIEDVHPETAAKIVSSMDADDAADLLKELAPEKAEEILSKIDDDEFQEDLKDLREYEENTAGGLMNTNFFQVKGSDTKQMIIDLIPSIEADLGAFYDLYVLDDQERLIGTISLRELLAQKNSIEIKEIMNKEDVKFLTTDSSYKMIAQMMSKYNLLNIPIVDDQSHLLGVVSVDDVLPWILDD
jgi:magnesium transporter